jgi:GNAT superfamily N-acetyltransferase
MKVTVRPATEPEVPALPALYGELNPDDAPSDNVSAAAVWAAVARQHGRTILIADAGGAVAGTADCLVMPDFTRGGRAVLFVENVVVAAAFQRRGVGRRLMAAVVELASAGCYKVQLLAADDEHVHAFYEACGFAARRRASAAISRRGGGASGARRVRQRLFSSTTCFIFPTSVRAGEELLRLSATCLPRGAAATIHEMSTDEMNRPPTPVLAAVGIYALLAVVSLIGAVALAIAGAPALALLGLGALLPGSVALGLWQGNRGARVTAFVLAVPSILGAIALIFLLAVPESSRTWFTPDELDEEEFGNEDGDDVGSEVATDRR